VVVAAVVDCSQQILLYFFVIFAACSTGPAAIDPNSNAMK